MYAEAGHVPRLMVQQCVLKLVLGSSELVYNGYHEVILTIN